MAILSAQERLHPYQTIFNFRDFGGYQGLDGAIVSSGKLFRSAHLNKLSDSELQDIGNLGIGLVVDLRYAPERVRQPSRLPDPAPIVFEFPDPPELATRTVAPHEAFLEHELKTREDAHGYMMRSYTARPHDSGFKTIFRDTLLHMADNPNSGALVHCAAGKDRTGTLCALIQGLLGVSRDDIMADYMLTLDAVDIEAILAPASEMFSKRYGRPIDADMLWPMFGVAPEFINAALDGIGDYESYTLKELGVPDTAISKLRDNFLS